MPSPSRKIAIGTGGRRGYLLPWHEVPRGATSGLGELDPWWPGAPRGARVRVRRLSRFEAVALLRAADDDPDSARNLRALVEGPSENGWDRESIVERLADRLVGGSLVLVELHEAGPGWHGTGFTPPRQAGDATDGPTAKAWSTVLRVKVILDDGAPLAGAVVTLAAPDGQNHEGPASQRGEAELANINSDGLGRAVIRPAQVPRWRWGDDTMLSSEHIFDFSFGPPIAADVATGATRTIVLRRPEIERVEGDALGFALDSALLIPLDDHLAPTPALATALARLQRAPTLRLLIVGHASADGSASSNDALARRRAECTRHLLAGERDAWVRLASDHGSPADVQRLLRYLARVHDWPTEPTRVDGTVDAQVEAAVSAFQSTYNRVFDADILVDGVVGVETLGALFDVQRHELRHQLTALDVAEEAPRWFTATGVASAGARVLAHPGIPASNAAPGQRRVDLLLIDDIVAWRESHGLDRLYDVARFRTIPIAPRTLGRSDLVVQLVDHYGRILAGEPYRVITDEEEREGTSDDQGVVVERGLLGGFARLVCGEAVIVVDDPYHLTAKQRHDLVPPRDHGDDDDDWWTDAPPPAADDELDDDELVDKDDPLDGEDD
ncbi:peptidoglycan-binding protein [Nannocystis sp. SCPEA4]|uniref:peptidoglycan-binding protein n=1 Tax=Nannocystis sp. SCPEA4 TaxID=2996787 RepID=UPI0022700194|nr:peptidoglycan-binding protein [Nannocystis sp. SCPEA4]MCY1061474.1 peptidoglycan-binding protein [Nannocystis sp. SCPEA4]